MTNNRIFLLFCVLAVMAITAGGAWIAGARIVSPAEAAARTAPPAPSPILVPIEQRVLSSEIVTRGTARFGLPHPISIAPSALKANSAGLITTLPSANTQFKEGDVMLTTSGRPVFVLQGDMPAYRDLGPGAKGKDVRQLEEALQRMGFNPGSVDGTFDQETGAAVSEWYESAGFEPFGPTAEQLAALRALEVAVGDAKKAHMAAAALAENADLAVRAARARSQHTYRTATADIAVKTSERALISLDPRALQTARTAADANLELARAAVRSAELDGEVNYRAAIEAQKVAEFDAQLMAQRVDQLVTDLEKAERKLGVQMPLDELVFIHALPVRAEQITGIIGSAANGPVLSVTDNKIVIDSSLPLDAAPLVKPGMEVAIDEPAIGIRATGTVEMVAPTPGTHGVDGYHIYFAVRVGETATPIQGFSLRLTMPIKTTRGAVTTVPMSALSLAPDGTSRVQVERNGGLQYVAVEPGMAADGFVEIRPLDGALEPGQRVVIGTGTHESPDIQP